MRKISIVIILVLFTAVTVFCDDFGTTLRKAEQGSPEAQAELGSMYYTGNEVTKDYRRAAYWYRRSADQGYAKAQYNLGVMYDEGQGVARDPKQAKYWYKKAAKQGYAEL